MGLMHLVKMKFRHPVPDDPLVLNDDNATPEANVCKSSDSQVMLLAYNYYII